MNIFGNRSVETDSGTNDWLPLRPVITVCIFICVMEWFSFRYSYWPDTHIKTNYVIGLVSDVED